MTKAMRGASKGILLGSGATVGIVVASVGAYFGLTLTGAREGLAENVAGVIGVTLAIGVTLGGRKLLRSRQAPSSLRSFSVVMYGLFGVVVTLLTVGYCLHVTFAKGEAAHDAANRSQVRCIASDATASPECGTPDTSHAITETP